jgi:hypothetical protein
MNGTDSTKLPKLAGAGIPLAPTGDTDLGDEDRMSTPVRDVALGAR